MPGKTILVTGISGFIAKHCALELLRHGYEVRGTVRSPSKVAEVRATLAKHADVANLAFAQADLLSDAGWDDAMQGINAVLHLASPFPIREPKDPDELIRPAVEGTLRVLRAAKAAGVGRIVQTSSTVAIMYGHGAGHVGPFDEDDWTNVDGPDVSSYARSKTLAERAARDFITREASGIHFSTVNPGFVLGPLLDRDMGSSGEAIQMFLKGKYPACPRLSFPVVDVRDVATLHRLALETRAPGGGRYLAVSGTAWWREMTAAIKGSLGRQARRVPVTEMPNWLVRLVGIVDPAARQIVPELGRYPVFDNARTRQALALQEFISIEESAPAMARSLLELGLA